VRKSKRMQKCEAQSEPRWSPRSQRSLREEYRLGAALAEQRRHVASSEHAIAVLEKEADDLAKIQMRQGPILRDRMVEKLSDLEARKRLLGAHRAEIANLEAQGAKMEAEIVSGQQERARNQAELAATARARLATDAQLAAAIDAVSALLHQRNEETQKMLEFAKVIDLMLVGDGYDTERFEALSHVLPENLLLRSQAWVTWFLGDPRETRSTVVTEETFTLPESLASANFYRRGESVALTLEEYARLFPPKASTSRAQAEALFLTPAPQRTEVDEYWDGKKF